MNKMTLYQLKVFITVAECQNLTRAAELLHRTLPAISNHVKQLEDYFAQPLINLNHKTFSLTPAGERLYTSCKAIAKEVEGLHQDMALAKEGMSGSLAMVAAHSAKAFLPFYLKHFQNTYPTIKVQLSTANLPKAMTALKNQAADIAIVNQLPSGLPHISLLIQSSPLVIIASPSHPLTKVKGLRLASLCHEPFILQEPGSYSRTVIEHLFKKTKIYPPIAMESDNCSFIRNAVKENTGIALVPQSSIAEDRQLGQLDTLDVKDLSLVTTWYAVCLSNTATSHPAHHFMKFLSTFEHEQLNSLKR